MNQIPPYPFLKWVGGKRQLLPELRGAIKALGPFRNYHEPFLGGGALYFALIHEGLLSEKAYLSDINPNLIGSYLAVRDHLDRLIHHLQEHKRRHSEEYFYKVRAMSPRTEVTRAARIIYLNRTCFNGLYRENSKGQFNVPFGRYKNPRICDPENLQAVSETLHNADVAVREFSSVLERADQGDLVYFDPPYLPVSKTSDFTAYSKGGFGLEGQHQLAEVAHRLSQEGVSVMLSNSNAELIRELYKDFNIREVQASRRVNSKADRRGHVAELIITNFKLAD